MKSVATRRFWELFRHLSGNFQKLAAKNFRLLCQNRNHPSLRCRPLQSGRNRFSVRIGDHYRVIRPLDSAIIT